MRCRLLSPDRRHLARACCDVIMTESPEVFGSPALSHGSVIINRESCGPLQSSASDDESQSGLLAERSTTSKVCFLPDDSIRIDAEQIKDGKSDSGFEHSTRIESEDVEAISDGDGRNCLIPDNFTRISEGESSFLFDDSIRIDHKDAEAISDRGSKSVGAPDDPVRTDSDDFKGSEHGSCCSQLDNSSSHHYNTSLDTSRDDELVDSEYHAGSSGEHELCYSRDDVSDSDHETFSQEERRVASSRVGSSIDSGVTFFDTLEFPLVFIAHIAHNCYDDERSMSRPILLSRSPSTSSSTDEGIYTPEEDFYASSSDDDDNCENMEEAGALTRPNTLLFPSINCENNSGINKDDTMDDAHPRIVVSKHYNESAIRPSPPSCHVISRLAPVRESVSEEMVGDDPFVRRDVPEPWANRTDCLTVPVLDASQSSLLQRRAETSPVMSRRAETSPVLSRRRSRRLGSSLDIEEVKELTSRLNLQTRRPSVHAWRQENLPGGRPSLIARREDGAEDEGSGEEGESTSGVRWSRDFKDKIDSSLDWLRTELTSMREQDAILARKLLNIRKEMYRLKLQNSTLSHQLVLQEAMDIEDERDEIQQMRDCDLTPDLFSPTLKQYGVTRMNLHSRRFSVF